MITQRNSEYDSLDDASTNFERHCNEKLNYPSSIYHTDTEFLTVNDFPRALVDLFYVGYPWQVSVN